jgi:ABC-type polysaccharide/polyol phosphate transport system ATPase subunit
MIQVHDISKTFLLPKEKKRTLKEHVFALLLGRSRGFEPLHALRGVSFNVNKGEFFSIIGKNGSGKSTLLKILAGIYAPDNGGASMGGSVSPFLELGIGFNPDLTARENVFLSAAVLGLRRREIESMYGDIIGFAELERFQDQALKNFSSGMHVRLAFSVAFMVNADILLIDEVLAVGDASFQQKCYDVFRRLKSEGKTIIFVSHSMGDVKEFSDRVMLLHEGQMVSVGASDKVIHDYQLLTAREDEKRMAREESLKQEKETEAGKALAPSGAEGRWGSGRARVKGVTFYDTEGKEKHVYATGESVRMRIAFDRQDQTLTSLRATVALHRADGINVMETQSAPVPLDRPGEEGRYLVELTFPRIELLAAIYYFDVGLAAEGGAGEPFDFLRGCAHIRIYQDSESRYGDFTGISFLEHEWRTGE